MKDDTPFILECPSCRTRYEIPVSIPDGGRKVRCANCSHIWVAQPEDVFRMGEERSPEAVPRQEVVFRQGEDAPEGAASSERPAAEPEPRQGALPAAEAAFGADAALADDPWPQEEADPSDPHAFAAAVAEAEAMSGTTDDFARAADATGFDRDDDLAGPSGTEPEREEGFARSDDGAQPGEAADAAGQDGQADEVAAFYGDLIAQDAPVEEEKVPESPAPPAAIKRPARRKGLRAGVAAGWALLLLATGAILYLAVAQRVEIVRLMPGSAPLYEAVGLPVNVRGLDFRGVAYSWETDGGQVVLEVHGDIVNLTAQPLAVPSLVLGLRDESGAEVYQWEEAVMNAPLGAGDSATFAVRIPTPPKSIKSVQVRFARVR